jgi:hypothetical protein
VKHRKAWRVVRQQSTSADIEVCRHRWEWTAELCAHRRQARHVSGVFYTAYPAAPAVPDAA